VTAGTVPHSGQRRGGGIQRSVARRPYPQPAPQHQEPGERGQGLRPAEDDPGEHRARQMRQVGWAALADAVELPKLSPLVILDLQERTPTSAPAARSRRSSLPRGPRLGSSPASARPYPAQQASPAPVRPTRASPGSGVVLVAVMMVVLVVAAVRLAKVLVYVPVLAGQGTKVARQPPRPRLLFPWGRLYLGSPSPTPPQTGRTTTTTARTPTRCPPSPARHARRA